MPFLEVFVEEDAECPRCGKLIPKLRKICNDLNVPFYVRLLSTKSVAAYASDSVSRTFDPEWIKQFGLPEHKMKLKELTPILEMFKKYNLKSFPNLVIRWHDGRRMKEIVIRGYDESNEKANKQFLANLYLLLKVVKEVVYRR